MITAFHELFTVMEEKEMDILGVVETNINWSDGRQQEANMVLKM